jgi:hypothetical protein
MSIPVNPPIIPVIDADATSATSATSVVDDEFKFKLFYQKPKNDNVLKDLEMSHMGLKKCQNYIPIYSTFFSLNDTNYNSINLNHKHIAKTISAAGSTASAQASLGYGGTTSKNCANAIIFPNPNTKQCKNNGDDAECVFTPVFFKFSPLLDPVKYLAGNYNFKGTANVDKIEAAQGDHHSHLLDSLLSLPSIHSTPFAFDTTSTLRERSSPTPPPFTEGVVGGCLSPPTTTTSTNIEAKEKYNHYKILDANNSAYVDGFFSYLSSQLLNTHGFIHGIDFYGSYLAIQDEFTINIIDDYEYLMKNDFFKEKNGKLFKFDDKVFEDCSDDDNDNDCDENGECCEKKKQTRNRNPKLNVNKDKNIDIQFDDFNMGACDNIVDVDKSANRLQDNTELTELTESNIFNPENNENNQEFNINNMSCNSSSSSVSCSSRSSHTTTLSNDTESDDARSSDDDHDGESNSESNSGDTESTFETVDDDDDDCEEEVLNAVIYNFPVEVIMLERCTKTLDYLMVKDILSDEEWEAALMQIVITLATYQKLFSFTHNDLHTNNVMFIETEKEYIYYFFNKKYYKVPTFGRIFKIIDFGRSIYKFNSKFICSDSFHKSGDAATQYNCEPYFDEKKPCIHPNYSFDLCRLGCSLFDFFIENMEDVPRECKKNRLVSLVVDWVTDDNGRNILYKKDGVDRYPDFKLYKMIARTVHNKVPSQQLKHCVFTQYEVTQKNIKNVSKTEIINIDKFPVYI